MSKLNEKLSIFGVLFLCAVVLTVISGFLAKFFSWDLVRVLTVGVSISFVFLVFWLVWLVIMAVRRHQEGDE